MGACAAARAWLAAQAKLHGAANRFHEHLHAGEAAATAPACTYLPRPPRRTSRIRMQATKRGSGDEVAMSLKYSSLPTVPTMAVPMRLELLQPRPRARRTAAPTSPCPNSRHSSRPGAPTTSQSLCSAPAGARGKPLLGAMATGFSYESEASSPRNPMAAMTPLAAAQTDAGHVRDYSRRGARQGTDRNPGMVGQ